MAQSADREGRQEVKRKVTKLTLHKETLHRMTDLDHQDAARKTYGCTGTCIITGHPCPPPCG